MIGDFREAALVINHENRKKNTGEDDKDDDNAYGTFKKRNNGVPKSLRMVDKESERYQEEKKKKTHNGVVGDEDPAEHNN
mmetsp:Transcript_22601/g.25965  ORF Transcript_22601/g.25965 Transcript_22601/m.25965 type:complete len:80 (+) Transcript_22601:414-653(+)